MKDIARFDARLPREQKQFFERAARLGGYRNLTDFIIFTVQEKANEIISRREEIIATEKDAEIFFDALINPRQPSKTLKKAAEGYRAFMENSEKSNG